MASTHLKNTRGHYNITSKQYNDIFKTKLDEDVGIQTQPCFADLGILSGVMSSGYNHNILSNNTADIESNLFGIGSTNLAENTSNKVTPRINKLDKCSFFPLNKVYLPNPLVIEKYQRPPGPFS